jgi:hypothetical protein
MTGRAATSLNVLIFLGAFAVQSGFGLVVQAWGADAANRYQPVSYQAAFALVVLIQLPGFIGWLLGRCRQSAADLKGAAQQETLP